MVRIPKRLLEICLREGYSEDYVRALSGMRVELREVLANEDAIESWRKLAAEQGGDPNALGEPPPTQPLLPIPDLAGTPYTPAWLLRPLAIGEAKVVLNDVSWPSSSGEAERRAVEGHRTLMDIFPLADPEQDGLVYCPSAGEECLAFHQAAGHFRRCTVISEPSRATRFHARVRFHTKPVWRKREGREVLEWVPNKGKGQRHSDIYARFLLPFPGAAVTKGLGTAMMAQWMHLFE